MKVPSENWKNLHLAIRANLEAIESLLNQSTSLIDLAGDDQRNDKQRAKHVRQINALKKDIAKIAAKNERLSEDLVQFTIATSVSAPFPFPVYRKSQEDIIAEAMYTFDATEIVRARECPRGLYVAFTVTQVIKEKAGFFDLSYLVDDKQLINSIINSLRETFAAHDLILEDIQVKKGSVELQFIISTAMEWLAVAGFGYVAISQYKDFKIGVHELKKDVRSIAKAFEKRIRSIVVDILTEGDQNKRLK